MKKIFYIVMTATLLFSCGKKEPDVETTGSIYGFVVEIRTFP
jgi:hypothetical protein